MPITQVVAVRADNGSEYNTVPPNKSTVAGGNGGSGIRTGTVSNKLDNVAASRYDAGVFGSSVVDTNDVDSAGGTLAYNNSKPIAKRVTTAINGSSNDVLVSGASQPALIHSIHYIKVCGMGCVQGVRSRRLTAAIRAGKFNEFTGEFEAGYPVVASDTFENDHAALPSRSSPGELTYMSSSLEPVNDDYKEKTG